MTKPKVFIGSSVEGLNIAYAVQENLKFVAETTVWDQGAFNLSETTLESLLTILESSDFGVFVFSPDDYIKIRGKGDLAVRDNVLFELGLFVGKLGRKRSFIIVPDNKDFHLPTDLIGMTPGKYENERADGNMQAGTGSASNKIREAIKKLGSILPSNETPEIGSEKIAEVKANKNEWQDYLFTHKNYDKAIELLKKKVRYTKDIFEKNHLKGYICYAEFQKDPINGTKEYEKLIKENETENSAYFPYIDNLMWNNSFKKAIEICDLALSKCERKINLTNKKASCLWSLGKKVEAIELLNSAITDKQDPLLYISLSEKYIEQNDNKKALEVLHKAYFVFPNNEEIMKELASISDKLGHKELNLFLIKELTLLNPEKSNYWGHLGNAYFNYDLDNLALTAYEKGLELSKNKAGWIFDNIGNLYKKKGFLDKAEYNLKEALKINDKSEYTHNRLSSIFSTKEEDDKKVSEILNLAKAKLNLDVIE